VQHPFLVGTKVDFYAVEEEDFTERLLRWRNDPEVCYYLVQGTLPSTRELLKEEYERLIRSQNDVVLAVADKQTGKRVGLTGYYDIDWITRCGEWRIIIGEKEYWGKGFGNEILEIIFTFGFSRLNLNKIRAGANIENKVAIKLYQRLDCVQEGLFRAIQYRHGRYYDAAMFGIFRDEFVAAMKKIYGDGWSLEEALLGNLGAESREK